MIYHLPESVYWGTDLHSNEELNNLNTSIENLYKEKNTIFLSREDFLKSEEMLQQYSDKVYELLKDNPYYYNIFDGIVHCEDGFYLINKERKSNSLENKIIMLYNLNALSGSDPRYKNKILELLPDIDTLTKLFTPNDIKTTLIYKIYFIMHASKLDNLEELNALRKEILDLNPDNEKLEQQLFLEYMDVIVNNMNIGIKLSFQDKLNAFNDVSAYRYNHDDLYFGNFRYISLLFEDSVFSTSTESIELLQERIRKDYLPENKFTTFKTLVSHNEDFRLNYALLMAAIFTKYPSLREEIDGNLSDVEKTIYIPMEDQNVARVLYTLYNTPNMEREMKFIFNLSDYYRTYVNFKL